MSFTVSQLRLSVLKAVKNQEEANAKAARQSQLELICTTLADGMEKAKVEEIDEANAKVILGVQAVEGINTFLTEMTALVAEAEADTSLTPQE